jgi:hypothetical protein
MTFSVRIPPLIVNLNWVFFGKIRVLALKEGFFSVTLL